MFHLEGTVVSFEGVISVLYGSIEHAFIRQISAKYNFNATFSYLPKMINDQECNFPALISSLVRYAPLAHKRAWKITLTPESRVRGGA